jgi:hypothetical protein
MNVLDSKPVPNAAGAGGKAVVTAGAHRVR